jgi:hypothetical protein
MKKKPMILLSPTAKVQLVAEWQPAEVKQLKI